MTKSLAAKKEEAPGWIEDAAVVTEPDQTTEKTEKTEEMDAKIDTLHTLEVEHRHLTKRKERLEQKREQLTDEKNDLKEELEQDTTSGLWSRLTAAVTSSESDAKPDTGTTQDDATPAETNPNNQSTTADTDSKPYQQADDITEAIEILERDNTALETAIETLTQTTETLQTDIERIEGQLTAPSGPTERLSRVIAPFNESEPDEPHVIRQPRFNGAMASAAGKTDTKTATDANTPDRSRTSSGRSNRTSRQDLIEKTRNVIAEPKPTDAEQDKE